MFGENRRNIKIWRHRGIALMLCFFILFTVIPPQIFAKAASEEDMFISGFIDLPADVEAQTVPVGDALDSAFGQAQAEEMVNLSRPSRK